MHPLNIGPIGVTGSDSANAIAEEADVISRRGHALAGLHHRVVDRFRERRADYCVECARHDAGKHMSLPVVGMPNWRWSLGRRLRDTAPMLDRIRAQAERAKWDAYVAENVKPGNRPNFLSHRRLAVVNALMGKRDRVVAAAGGLPAEVTANWRTLDIGTVDVEFGFSCMGYEIAGGWGARIAQAEKEPDATVCIAGWRRSLTC